MRIFTTAPDTGNFSHQQKLMVAGLQGWPVSQAHKTWTKNNCLAKIGHRIFGGKAVKKSGGRTTNYRQVKHFHPGHDPFSSSGQRYFRLSRGYFFDVKCLQFAWAICRFSKAEGSICEAGISHLSIVFDCISQTRKFVFDANNRLFLGGKIANCFLNANSLIPRCSISGNNFAPFPSVALTIIFAAVGYKILFRVQSFSKLVAQF